MNETFWGRRFSLTALVTLAIMAIGGWFAVAQMMRLPPVLTSWALLPFQTWISDLRYGASFWLLSALGVEDPNLIFNHWSQGGGFRMALLAPVLLIALLLWLAGFDPIERLTGSKPATPHGSGRFASAREQAPYRQQKPGSLIVGAAAGRSRYWFNGPEHLLTLAPTRSGKGTCLIVPNLLTAERSILVIDPKGENAQITARHRETFGPVHVLDPFNESGLHNASFNPLDELDPKDTNFIDDAASFASVLIVNRPGGHDVHFDEDARTLLRGLIMLVALAAPAPRRNLVTVREYLTYPKEKFAELLELMTSTTEAKGAIAATANVFSAKNEKERSAILSTAQEQTNFLDSPALQKTLTGSDFRFADLKTGNRTVYLVLPQDRFDSHGRWIRLLVTRALQDMQRTKTRPEHPVLFLLDEFAAFGDMPMIKTAVGLMAGYGLQIWAFLQNWGQLEEIYGKGAHTFAANAGVFQAFNTNDAVTARYVSDLSGDTSRQQPLEQGRPVGGKLLTPEEVMHLGDHQRFLKFKGTRPILAAKVPYFRDRRLSKRADASTLN